MRSIYPLRFVASSIKRSKVYNVRQRLCRSFLHLASKPALLAHFTNSLPRLSKKFVLGRSRARLWSQGLVHAKLDKPFWLFRPERLSSRDSERDLLDLVLFFVHDKKNAVGFPRHMLSDLFISFLNCIAF